jgi:hypothetical protein
VRPSAAVAIGVAVGIGIGGATAQRWGSDLATVWPVIQSSGVLPAAVGLVGVFIAVELAFGRYKRERLWERKLQALADVTAAISALWRLNDLWLQDHEDDHSPETSASEERSRRFRESEWKLREVAAVARALWIDGVPEVLSTVEASFDEASSIADLGDVTEAYEFQGKVFGEALARLAEIGRQHVRP